MINTVSLYGKIKGAVNVATTRSGHLKLSFEVAVRRPPGTPPKRGDDGRPEPDYVPVMASGRVAEVVFLRLRPWTTNGDGGSEAQGDSPSPPFVPVDGLWSTHLGSGRVHHECLATTVIVHPSNGLHTRMQVEESSV